MAGGKNRAEAAELAASASQLADEIGDPRDPTMVSALAQLAMAKALLSIGEQLERLVVLVAQVADSTEAMRRSQADLREELARKW